MSFSAKLILLLFYLLFISRISHSYVPSQRRLSASTLLGQKIYFLGGFLPSLGNTVVTRDFFYLDCNSSFDKTKGIPFTDLSYLSGIPLIAATGASIFGPNSDEIFIFGGWQNDSLIHIFNEKNNSWTSSNTPVPNRQNTKPIFNSEKVFIFGGYLGNGYYQYMDILNTVGVSWSNGSLNGAPSARDGYAAILRSDGTIIYFGGWLNGITIEINMIYLYNTKTDSWRSLTTVGEDLGSRGHFSAVLTKDEKSIIIYGGETKDSVNGTTRDANVILAKLDISTEPFRWSIPNISGTPLPPLVNHNAHIVDNFMILAFGYSHINNNFNGEVYILDISDDSKYKLVNSFNPTNSSITSPTMSSITSPTMSSTTSTQSNPSSSSDNVKIIASVSGVIFAVLVIFLIYFLYRRKKQHSNILRIPHQVQ